MPVNSFIMITDHDGDRVLENIDNIKRVISHNKPCENPHCRTKSIIQTYDDVTIRSTDTIDEIMRAISAEMQGIADAFKGSISL